MPADGETPVWNADVRFFKLLRDGQPKAYFFLDPYSRPAEKRGGAWMAEARARERERNSAAAGPAAAAAAAAAGGRDRGQT